MFILCGYHLMILLLAVDQVLLRGLLLLGALHIHIERLLALVLVVLEELLVWVGSCRWLGTWRCCLGGQILLMLASRHQVVGSLLTSVCLLLLLMLLLLNQVIMTATGRCSVTLHRLVPTDRSLI